MCKYPSYFSGPGSSTPFEFLKSILSEFRVATRLFFRVIFGSPVILTEGNPVVDHYQDEIAKVVPNKLTVF